MNHLWGIHEESRQNNTQVVAACLALVSSSVNASPPGITVYGHQATLRAG